MGLSKLPTRGTADSDLGPEKKNNPLSRISKVFKILAEEWNASTLAVYELAQAVGLADGSTVGSLVALLKNLGTTPIPGVIAVGPWTPTVSNTTNLTTTAHQQGMFIRVSDRVVFFEALSVTPTAGGAISYNLTPPVVSNFATSYDGGGGIFGVATTNGRFNVDPTTDTLQCFATDTVTSAHVIYHLGMMKVL